jgi:ribonuclease G
VSQPSSLTIVVLKAQETAVPPNGHRAELAELLSRKISMARNILVINCDLRETRVCLIEDGVIAELHLERQSARGAVGNIVLGKVTRVLPGMQAAFIDVGMERAAFLHVEDLIRPDDFEAYLARGTGDDALEGGRRASGLAEELDIDIEDEDEEEDEDTDSDSDEDEDDTPVDAGEGDEEEEADESDSDSDASLSETDSDSGEVEDESDGDTQERDDDDAAEDESAVIAPAGRVDAAGGVGAHVEPPAQQALDDSWVIDAPPAAGATAEPSGLPEAAETTREEHVKQPVGASDKASRRGPRGRQGGSRSSRASQAKAGERSAPRRVSGRPGGAEGGRSGRKSSWRRQRQKRGNGDNGSRQNGHGRRSRAKLGNHRTSRSVPITDVVRDGDQVIVQISKEPIGTKGARVTSHVSLPGRYVVYLPTVEHVGISRRIGSARERGRLRKVIEALKPPTGGLIVRTVAAGLTKKALKRDIAYLIKLWEDVSRKHETAKAPAVLYSELDLVLKTARDLFTPEIERIVIDGQEQHARLVRFVEMFMPERVNDIELYTEDEPIFDAYGIEDEIGRALSRKVPLSSGGHLIIDQAEALTAIDVNTGRYVGKGSKDLEETALRTNLEAVAEIAYQLRFRNIGGLVILDLIDMDLPNNRETVWRALEQALSRDKAKTTLNRISELGLIEMTRKRTRESLSRTMHEPCFYCDGTGQIQSRTTIAYEILRQIRRERDVLKGYSVVVNAHPAIVDLMQGEEKEAVADAERRYMRRIELIPRREYHIEQFDLQGK